MRKISIVFFSLLLVALIVSVMPITNAVTPACPSKCKLDIAFALDVSGSMSGQPLADLKNATITFINLTCPDCAWSIGLVAFNTSVYNLTFTGTPNNGSLITVCSEDNKTTLRNAVTLLTAGGLTNMGGGIYNATTMVLNSDRSDADNVIVVVSDGVPTIGPDAAVAANYAKSLGFVIIGVFVGDASGAGDEYLRYTIASTPEHFINASIQSGLNMTEAFLILFDKLCHLVTLTPMVGGSIETTDLVTYRNLVLLLGVAVAVSVGIISIKKK